MKSLNVLGCIFSVLAIAYFTRTSLVQTNQQNNLRSPASIPPDINFSYLSGEQLLEASKKRMLSGLRSMNKNGQIGLQAGHFALSDENSQGAYACDVYDKITYTFVAEGIAVSGESPSMIVESPCEKGVNPAQTAPVWLPIAKILSYKPTNMEVKFENELPVKLTFTHMPSEWPTQWVLTEVKMIDAKSLNAVSLEARDIYRLSGKPPITLNWDEF